MTWPFGADRVADEAEWRGLSPTMTPEEGLATYPELYMRWYRDPAIGETEPALTEDEWKAINDAFEYLKEWRATFPPFIEANSPPSPPLIPMDARSCSIDVVGASIASLDQSTRQLTPNCNGSTRPAGGTAATPVSRRRTNSDKDDRDAWLFSQYENRENSLTKIQSNLSAIHKSERWDTIDTDGGVYRAIQRYASRKSLPMPQRNKTPGN
jgi:hypothetical protein